MTKKQVIFWAIVIFILLGLWYFFQVRECVVNRAAVGIPSDWATIKDCSY
ncbi:MAG: hypothetical protein Q7K55_01375 [Candidatus Levybacteria bacterium]|nr:hypothetical protein [Candidatus Levybacteria bacterium]